MHALIKSSFYLFFIVSMVILGTHMLLAKRDNLFYKKFGLMTLILGLGEAFHLIPRVLNIFSSDLIADTNILKSGQLISSITIIIVYLLLHDLWKKRYNITEFKWLTNITYLLAIASVVMSLVIKDPSTLLLIVKNIPLILIGIITIVTYSSESKIAKDLYFKYFHLAVALSFVFYMPVVFLEKTSDLVVILMLPKTIMYLWMMSMGYKAFRKETIKK